MNTKNLEELRDFYEYYGLELLDDKIGGKKIKHKCKDIGGYLYYLSYEDVKQNKNHSHSIVAKYNPFSIQNIQQYIYNHNSKTQVLDKHYIANKSKIRFRCECGREYSINWNRVHNLHKVRCNHCGYKYITIEQSTPVEELRKEVESYGYKLVDGVTQKSKSLTVMNEDGEILHTNIYVFRNGGMPCSRMSNIENSVKKYLDKKHIKYEQQKTFEYCKYKNLLKFDFYLPKYNTCIEVNSKQHYKPIKLWGGEERLEEQQLKDNIKKEYCEKNGINFIIIPYWDFNKEEKYKTYIDDLLQKSKEPV